MSCTPPGGTQGALNGAEVERSAGRNDDLLRSRGRELVDVLDVCRPVEQHAALDARRMSANLLAPLVKDAALVREGRGRPEPGPDVRVLRDHAEYDPFPFAADHQRQRPDGRRVELGEPFLDPDDAGLQRGGPAPDGAEVEAVLGVVAFRPARS